MSFKKNIKLLIDILEKSKIRTLEVSSFWGFKKIKLSKDLFHSETLKHNIENQDSNDRSDARIKREDMHSELDLKLDINSKSNQELDNKISNPESGLECIEAPLVGTVYLSAKPGEPQFVNEGDTIQKGEVICIIEAMKIFNEIESDKAGVIRKILVKNEDPIEFGQPLIEIEP